MAYPDTVTQRAIELYEQGHSAGAIVKALQLEFPSIDVPDERTVRRWYKDQRTDTVDISKSQAINTKHKEEHFNQLAEIVRVLLSQGVDMISDTEFADQYEIVEEDYTTKTSTHHQLIGTLEGNLDLACQKFSPWEVFECLMAHIKTEHPALEDLYGYVNEHPLEYINIMRTLAQRKTFKGTCPVCKDL
jgi:ribulose bisphosphate carboxylase small subunit